MFVSPAFAQDAAGGMGGIGPLVPLILIFVVFYFLLIRPQQKKAKAHREMISGLRRGDRIVTSGGLIGQIHRVIGDNELLVEVADGVRVRVMRGMVSELVAKPEAARDDDQDDDEDEDKPTETRAKARRRQRREAAESAGEGDESAESPDDGEPSEDQSAESADATDEKRA